MATHEPARPLPRPDRRSAAPFAPLTLTAVLLGLPTPPLAAQEEPPRIEAFHFGGQTLGGRRLDQDALRDHVVLVDLWGTWCGPCRQAVPVLVDLYAKYKHHGLEILGFSYAADGGPEDADRVRRFAAEQKVTYELLPGDPAVRDQVPGFRGYPTLLLFGKGWRHEDTHVGFDAGLAANLERRIRAALGLDAQAGPETAAVPAGRYFEPGNGDRDVELDYEDLHGKAGSLAALRGGPVLLALTTSWDREAERTARFLQGLQRDLPGLRVIGWYLEQSADADERRAAARSFAERLQLDYTAFTTPLRSAREKVHKFASLPTLLLLDADGVLVQREAGISEEIEARVRARAAELAPPR
ncbi:MAG: TlpA family protein disulfide reductase [Planctomycetota bacterium]